MVNYSAAAFDQTFAALANPIRRGILETLRKGTAPVSDLAAPYEISLPGLLKHISVLERAGLVETVKHGRVRTCRLTAAPLLEAAEWLAFYAEFWDAQLGSLEGFLTGPDPNG